MLSPAPAPAPAPARMTLVDGLRGVAALMVLAFHFCMAARLPQEPAAWMPDAVEWVLEHGWLGVQLFFVLSGFVIAYSIRGQAVTPGFVGRFALRRAIRLDPPYWVAIAVEVALFAWIGTSWEGSADAPRPAQVAAHLMYLQEILGLGHVVGVFWTLCLEVQLYVGFVLLLLLAQRLTRTRGEAPRGREALFLLPFVPVLVLSFRWLAVGGSSMPWATRYAYMFMLGALACWSLEGLVRARWLVLLVAATLVSITCVRWEPMAVVALLAVGLLALGGRTGGLWRWLNWRPLQWVGRRSYSLYLLHLIVGDRLVRWVLAAHGRTPLTFLAACALGLGASLAAAWLLHRCVEEPSTRWARLVRLAPAAQAARPPAPVPVPEPAALRP